MKRAVFLMSLLLLLSILAACGTGNHTVSEGPLLTESSSVQAAQPQESETQSKEDESVKIQITVGDTTLTATPEKKFFCKSVYFSSAKRTDYYTYVRLCRNGKGWAAGHQPAKK